jgi:hypothetical protein
MASDRLPRQVAREAARLIHTRQETQYGRAKAKVLRQFTAASVGPSDLPDNWEIRRQLRRMGRAGPEEQRRLLGQEEKSSLDASTTLDRFRTYQLLLLPLEHVAQSPEKHPEGDVLYHSLQVFELARQRLPYDEEFLLAALLHDVGKAIDRRDHVAAGLEALRGAISPRTAWLIEHHVEALELREEGLGTRQRRRLEASENFEDLRLLAECDRHGRAIGADVPDVREAIDYLRDLARQCGETG